MGYLWKHCDKCEAEMTHPTDVDYIVGSVRCNECDHENEIDPLSRRYGIEEIYKRLVDTTRLTR